jgi:flagellar hook assembly protein FlgD
LTTVQYDLPEASNVTINIYDIQGSLVATLVDRREDAGSKSVQWNGSNLSSGVYILQMIAKGESGNQFTDSRKMVLIK